MRLRKVGRSWNCPHLEPNDGVRFGGVYLQGQSRELIRAALLQENSKCCGRGYFDFPEVKATRALAEVPLLIEVASSRRNIFLEVCPVRLAVGAVKNLEPRGALVRGRRIGKRIGELRLLGTGHGNKQESEQSGEPHGGLDDKAFLS